MSNFYNITLAEMRDFLLPQGYREMNLEDTGEVVFGKRVEDYKGIKASLRIYTAISRTSQNSRENGSDAIHVCLFMWVNDGPTLIGTSKHVKRTKNWRKHLNDRLLTWEELLPPAICKCGRPMVEREGKFGKFLGCTSYPKCQETRQLKS